MASFDNISVPVGLRSFGVSVGDFNRDGIDDLAVGNEAAASPTDIYSRISILLGSGNGSFSIASNFNVGGYPAGVTVGDFNRDGIDDLAVGGYDSNNISIALGIGNGSFGTATNFSVGSFSLGSQLALEMLSAQNPWDGFAALAMTNG